MNYFAQNDASMKQSALKILSGTPGSGERRNFLRTKGYRKKWEDAERYLTRWLPFGLEKLFGSLSPCPPLTTRWKRRVLCCIDVLKDEFKDSLFSVAQSFHQWRDSKGHCCFPKWRHSEALFSDGEVEISLHPCCRRYDKQVSMFLTFQWGHSAGCRDIKGISEPLDTSRYKLIKNLLKKISE